jgi:hypothetical protein
MIVKVQRSVYTTHGKPLLLIYNEDNSMRGQWRLNEEWAARFSLNGDIGDFKFYAEVLWGEPGVLPAFISRAPEQPW